MTEILTPTGYEQTNEKLADLEQRLRRLANRTGLSRLHEEEARRSYEQMIGQYRREIKLYEASHPEAVAKE
jgi:hypothetical protein